MIYSFFTFIIWIVCAPFLFVLSFKKKYQKSIVARFFLYKNASLKNSDIHFHMCSYGEVNACVPLLKEFRNLSITTITNTGYELAKNFSSNLAFLPYEMFLPFWLNKSKVVVIFEAELWLNLVRSAKKNGSYVILLNARISDKSYNRYLKAKFYYKKVFECIDLVLAQSENDKKRLEELCAKNVQVVGNIKSANLMTPSKIYNKFNEKVICIASTHEGEEELILKNLKLKENESIILAPRHPERFDKVDKIFSSWAKDRNLSYEKFSQNLGLKSRCILLDALGELINFYNICDIVILGGSFIKGIGGHNPIEVAQFEKILINGKFIENQKALFSSVENVYFCDVDDIDVKIHQNLKASRIKNRCDLNLIKNIIIEKIENGKSL
ncbi:lipid IV(A) 3-deoxy-D-manno-octulosonic acid transferase [Campylobacter sputorum]|uniref:lipid IV(A) 3-deoxy-D-manno-octulosonic acid transferase n=1 Tax=Campylobacter sputorum TaxID=206 RepID=UPI00053BE3E3|nr:lipid IV(A) 3-deoxy-D-manno-octulosonic acid transferase [Campylobacter sputorum]